MSTENLSNPLPTHKTFRNLLGHEPFGRLTVLAYLGTVVMSGKKRQNWRCLCSCGKSVSVTSCSLISGNTTSCGCFHDERTGSLNRSHGHTIKNRYGTPTYNSWKSMIQRCTNAHSPQWQDYGGRGVIVCESWTGSDGFSNFISDLGERPDVMTLYRFPNNNGNYEPGNCRWATKKQQARNRRTTVFVDWQGQRTALQDVSEDCGVTYGKLRCRLNAGWSIARATGIGE